VRLLPLPTHSVTGDYSHWGYADLDMIIGNLPLFIEREELESYDVVTYSFGDAHALYLRGQWTMHRNRPEVNEVWRRCAHLGAELERELSAKVTALRQGASTRFLSAEGCYSSEALQAKMRIRMATKQMVGLEVPSSQQVLFVAGSVWVCPGDVPLTGALLTQMSERTGREPCRTTLPPLQRSTGEPTRLEWSSTEGCGKWMPADFRMCAVGGGGASSTLSDPQRVVVTAKDGSFYSQPLEEAGLELENQCRQTSFFHFQEWKKVWSSNDGSSGIPAPVDANGAPMSRIAPLRHDQLLNPPPFRVSVAGVSLLSAATGKVLPPGG